MRSDRRYRLETGIFHSAGNLRDTNDTSYVDDDKLRWYLRWLNDRLPAPRKLNIVHSIFWFKAHVVSCAPDLWKKIEALKELLDSYGYAIEYRQTQRPGYIVYEDYYQIAAIPFKDTFE
jgi:hypothetical protein